MSKKKNNKELIIKVVSYKRPDNNTCKLLKESKLENWKVFVYKFDPYLIEYIENYGEHVHVINFDKANLPKKRQLVLDTTFAEGYEYCIMLDDDIEQIDYITDFENKTTEAKTISDVVTYMLNSIKNNDDYVALSSSYNISTDLENKNEIEDYKNICNNSIFNMKKYQNYTSVKYNADSKCEDMEFTMDMILAGCKTGRLKYLLMHNILQGGTTDDGLSYRFKGTNRFIEEGTYMKNHYPEYSEVFEYDENHFKMNTKKLLEIIDKNCLH